MTQINPNNFDSISRDLLSNVRMLLNNIFRCLEILVYFLSCDPEN